MAENTELDDPPRSIFMDSDDDEEIQRVSRPKKHILNDSSDDDEPGRVRYSSCRLNGDNGESEDRTSSHVSVPGPLDDSSADEESSPVEYSQGVESTLPTSLPLRCERSSDDQSDEEEASYVKSRCSSSVPQPAGSSSDSSQSSSSGESDDEVSIEAIKSKIISKTRAMKSTAVIEIPEGACDRSGNSKSKKEKVPSRKAKEAALAEIHSETQRMMRERKVSLPYHKPKQRTLEDFLNRRKSAPAVRLKTTSDELAKVWKHVEEREKNAELFYRSESDDDLVETDRAAMNSSIDSNTKKNPDEPPPGEISAPNNEIQIEADPQSNESEEFPRLQLSEILACSEDINNTVCENTSLPKSSEITRAEIDVVAPVTGNSTASTTAEIVSVESEPLETSDNTPDTFNNTSLSEKIDNLNLPISKCPKITGAPDEMIDLDDLSSKPGAFGLMKRFLKHAKLKPKKRIQDNTLNIISTEVDESGVVVGVSGETIKLKKEEPKPGERLVVLKTALQQKIAVNREQQLAKRMEEYRMYEDEFYGVDKTIDDELEEELLFDDEHHAQRAGKNLHEDVEDTDEKDVDNPFLDEEAAESGEDEVIEKIEEMGESEDKDENTDCEDDMDDNSSTSEDSDDESNSLQDTNEENATLPPIPTGLLELTGTQSAEAFNESQLIALCSGNFSSSTINLQKLETSSEEIQFQDVPDDEAGADTPRKALESDSDDEEVAIENKSQKKRKKLTFSDDEDDDANGNVSDVDEEDAVDNEVINENECVDEEDAAEQENVDDDDEEVELARKLGKGFLEHEAELSESEWGSDDEDEKGLDAYEEEEGDRDKISQRRLNKELGKIHAREVLAEDNREIRILQELLLEDGELHSDGPKRQRLFRWYNQDDDNAGEKRTLDFGENGGENEEDDEDIWRQQRLLRENFLRKKKIDNLDLQNVDSPVNFNDTRKGLKTTPKMSPAVPKSPDVKSQFSIFAKRGSFLNRGEKMLSKLAEITNNAGTKEKSLGNSRNNRNMVFSVVSPPKEFPAEEEQEIASKRKGEPLDKVAKKLKLGNRNNNCSTDRMSALAQLKLFESI